MCQSQGALDSVWLRSLTQPKSGSLAIGISTMLSHTHTHKHTSICIRTHTTRDHMYGWLTAVIATSLLHADRNRSKHYFPVNHGVCRLRHHCAALLRASTGTARSSTASAASFSHASLGATQFHDCHRIDGHAAATQRHFSCRQMINSTISMTKKRRKPCSCAAAVAVTRSSLLTMHVHISPPSLLPLLASINQGPAVTQLSPAKHVFSLLSLAHCHTFEL